MTRDQRRVLRALRTIPQCTQFHISAAFILLNVNGLQNALDYVEAVRNAQQPQLPLDDVADGDAVAAKGK